MSNLETLATIKFPPKVCYREGSWGSYALDGEHASTMTLYREGAHLFIEWDFPSLETTETIGLGLEGKRIVDYDGVMSFPRPAYKWLRSLGYVIAKDII